MKSPGIEIAVLAIIATSASSMAAGPRFTFADDVIARHDHGTDADRIETELYIVGVEQGFSWANSDLQNRNQPLLYCQPPRLGLTVSEDWQMFETLVEDDPTEGKWPAPLTMLNALQKTFPCPKSSK